MAFLHHPESYRPELLSQHQLPVGDVDPFIVLETYFANRCDPLETELFMQSHTCLVRKSRSAYGNVYASRPQGRQKLRV